MKLIEVSIEWKRNWKLKCEPGYVDYSWRRLEIEALSKIGNFDINEITSPTVLKIFREMEAKGFSIPVRKIHSHLSMIFDYAIACGYTLNNPVRGLKKV